MQETAATGEREIDNIVLVGVTGFAAALVAVTLLPFSGSHAWWVRLWDFPRVQIALALAAVLAPTAMLKASWTWPLGILVAGCLMYQVWRILPYTPFARREMRFAPPGPAQITFLAANVLMENVHHERLKRLIETIDPDVLLLMETDRRWTEGLDPLLDRYPTVLREPRDNYYGLIFATRLEPVEARIVYLTLDDTPSLFAELRARDGAPFRFIGLHPQPPVPGVDTVERDAQILYAARFARKSGVPLIAMGDFNDAAWSDTAQSFKTLGRYVDPRIGRGFYASFDANRWLLRCPIDQIYVTEDVAMVSLRLGPHFGSDHFPVIAQVRIDPELAASLNAPTSLITADDEAAMSERMADYGRKLDAVTR